MARCTRNPDTFLAAGMSQPTHNKAARTITGMLLMFPFLLHSTTAVDHQQVVAEKYLKLTLVP